MGDATRITHATNAIGKISRGQKSISLGGESKWIPAFAGMTKVGAGFRPSPEWRHMASSACGMFFL